MPLPTFPHSLLFDQALLAEGGQPDHSASFVKRVNPLMLGMSGEQSNAWRGLPG